MDPNPPPLPPSRLSLFHKLAWFSWMSVVMDIGVNVFLLPKGGTQSRIDIIERSVVVGGFALAGVGAGIAALCAIPRYGRKGLLWPAVTGLCLWLLLLGTALSTYSTLKKIAAKTQTSVTLAPAVHAPGARQIRDDEAGFAFDLPEGYEALPESDVPKGYQSAFVRQMTDEPNRILIVKRLGMVFHRGKLDPKDLPAGRGVSLTSFHWRGLEVEAFRVPEKSGEIDYLTFNVQIPLRKQAIQLGIGGPVESESQLRALVEQILSTLEGETNW